MQRHFFQATWLPNVHAPRLAGDDVESGSIAWWLRPSATPLLNPAAKLGDAPAPACSERLIGAKNVTATEERRGNFPAYKDGDRTASSLCVLRDGSTRSGSIRGTVTCIRVSEVVVR